MTILEVKNLTKNFEGVCAVNNLSLKIEDGLITSIIGQNGSGKTTLVNILSGIVKMDKGKIITKDKEVLEKIIPSKAPRYGICRTFQNSRLFEQMTVLDNILVILTERNIFKSIFEKDKIIHLENAKKILQKINLWEKKKELAINLSYGQRKLLEIGRALAMDSEIILLDEPFAGLFPEMVKIVSAIIKEMKKDGKTIILIEHNMELIRALSDYIFVMDEGRLLAEGEPAKVLENKKVIDAYLG
ncbi:MAG: ABC transporter ATP-binding protein [bacterium]